MKLIESAISHFSNKQIRSLLVSEWETTVFAKNLTLEDKAKIYARSNGNSTDYLIYGLIFGLTDEKGDSVFTLEDKVALKTKVDPEIVSRLSNFVFNTEGKTEEDREKN
jgi:hypothetical protein